MRLSRTPMAAIVLVALAGTVLPAASALAQQGRPAAPQAAAQRDANSELPIRNITLYRSGVGYFERQAQITGSRDIQLRFNTDQINDILKSMVVLDLGGGRVDSVGYGSKAPLDRRLSSFAVNVADNPDMPTLLNRLRGAPVRVVSADGPVMGTILGVETRPKAAGDRQVVNTPYLNLVTESGIRSLDLTMVASFEILDRDLAGELNKALSALAEHRADRIKTVDISFTGQGERRVAVAYVHEMPVWKTSYRLVLPDHPTGDQVRRDAESLTLQGWAIVENTSDEDWENVRLSLVAGRPVSFEMDLYEPLFAQRPRVPVPTVAGVMPRLYQAAIEARDARLAIAAEALQEAQMRRGVAPGHAAAPESPQAAWERARKEIPRVDISADDLAKYAPGAAAQAGEVGQVFQYQLAAPVSVARQRSAMLPILNGEVQGRRVSIYSRGDGSEHPMRGVEVSNTSGLQLMPGPISVFDGPSYAGDAQIGHVAAGDKRLLAYAVDLDVHVVVRDDSTSTLQRVRIVNGMVEETTSRRSTTKYAFNNKDQKRPRLMLLEHPRMAGWDLVQPQKPAEETRDLYRFEVEVPAGRTGEFEVAQHRVERQRLAMTEYHLPRLLAYVQEGKTSQRVVDAVRRAADMQSEINELKRQIGVLDQERNQIHQDQNRIRQNMGSIGRDSDLYRQYMQRLTTQESRLDAMTTERENLQKQQETKERELDAYLRNLNVE